MATQLVKLQKKYVGRKVIMLDGERTTIAKMLATCFKTEEGVTLKATELKELGSGTLKQIDTAPAAKASARAKAKAKAPAARTTRASKAPAAKAATTRRGSSAEKSNRGRRPNVEVLEDYSDANRRACQNYLKNVAELYEEMSEMSDFSLDELREQCNEHLNGGKRKPKAKVNSEVLKSARNLAAAAKEKVLTRKSSVAAKPKAELENVKRKTAVLKDRVNRVNEEIAKDTVVVDQFAQPIVNKIQSTLEKRIGALIRNRTGYDVTVAVTYAMWNNRRCTIQIGLLPTDATDKEIAQYSTDVVSMNRDLEDEDLIQKPSGDFDDDLGEFDAAIADSSDEEEEEEDTEEFDNESTVDIALVVKGLQKQIGNHDKRLPQFVEAWFNEPQVEETFGDDVKIGTELINSLGNIATVCGFHSEKDRVVLFDTAEEKFTFAKLIAVAKMDFAEDVNGEQEEELEEELEEDLEDDSAEDETDEESFDD